MEALNNEMAEQLVTAKKLGKKDFESDQEVRWCPGCGDYAILATLQRVLPDLGIEKEKHVFVSGIGCSSRFPYYMNTFGFHTIHGRAPTVATGLRLTRPDLKVWVVTGDGDALSIGGNHFIHLVRRNLNLTVLLFNNRIYGLTKGQYSPTSEFGKITKSTPYGSLESPLDPLSLALAAGASFVARSAATDAQTLSKILLEAANHQGTSVVEILQNCNVFNDGAFDSITDRDKKKSNQLVLADGQPLVFGENAEKAIVADGFRLKVVEHSPTVSPVIFNRNDSSLAALISKLTFPQFPVPMGVIYQENRPTYEALVNSQIEASVQQKGKGDLQKLLSGSDSWRVS